MTLEAVGQSEQSDDQLAHRDAQGAAGQPCLRALRQQRLQPARRPGLHDRRARAAPGPAQIAVNKWTFLAATYDGGSLKLYVDGTQVSTVAVSGTIAPSSGLLKIGGNAIWGEWFNGLIDEIRIYNRALTAGEIQTDMNTPVVRTPSPPSTPAGLGTTGRTPEQHLGLVERIDRQRRRRRLWPLQERRPGRHRTDDVGDLHRTGLRNHVHHRSGRVRPGRKPLRSQRASAPPRQPVTRRLPSVQLTAPAANSTLSPGQSRSRLTHPTTRPSPASSSSSTGRTSVPRTPRLRTASAGTRLRWQTARTRSRPPRATRPRTSPPRAP